MDPKALERFQPVTDHQLAISLRPCGRGCGGVWLRLSGEADLNSCSVLASTLAIPLAAGGDIELDLTDQTFADVAVVRRIACTAATLAPGRKLVLIRPAPAVWRVIQMCWPDQRGLEVSDG
jgi:hypothetical protein